ncbi:MAG TPA: M20/M25/M40 family metallo-hydrolase, partial [Chitinophagaceae bacterium]|nr:M20/M25/M40 family metallo-hydrolase [Chitinophagaceae bacterium]
MKRLLLLTLVGISATAIGQTDIPKLKEKTNAAAAKLEARCIEWRRDLHRHPELGNHETRTAKIIADHLKELGIETKEGIAKTGVVGILKGGKPGPCIALRADIDALPVTERGDLPFISKQQSTYNGQDVGVMHACGHDAHT